jgi:3-isopropylmalate/(R)-2-methylmalate dehydratase small subunit
MTEAFTRLHATCVPFVKDDLDTDQIIPARFLTGTTKTGLGEKLFYDWRYDEQGGMKADSIFDNARYSGAQVLVSGHNFGCGSSREHAPWSLKDYGIRAIFAVSFADIFYNNALKNFLLPVALPQEVIQVLAERIEQEEQYRHSSQYTYCSRVLAIHTRPAERSRPALPLRPAA